MEKNQLTQMSLINKMVLICWFIIATMLTASYALRFIQHTESLGYFLFVFLGFEIPVLVSFLIYKSNPETNLIKHIAAFGYGVIYSIVLFTASNFLTFVYVFPMLVIITLYADERYSFLVGVAVSLVNLGFIIFQRVTIPIDDVIASHQKIQIASIVLVSFFTAVTTKTVKKVTGMQIAEIDKEKEAQQQLIAEIQRSSENIENSIRELNKNAEELSKQSNTVMSSMNDIVAGTADTAESVQSQLKMTHAIGQDIEHTYELTQEMSKGFNLTRENAARGSKNADELFESSKVMDGLNHNVEEAMNVLEDKVKEAYQIIEVINSIA